MDVAGDCKLSATPFMFPLRPLWPKYPMLVVRVFGERGDVEGINETVLATTGLFIGLRRGVVNKSFLSFIRLSITRNGRALLRGSENHHHLR